VVPRATTLERRFGLQTLDQRAGLAQEGGLLGSADGLAGDELLAERVHERAALGDPVVEMRPGGEAGGADVADHLALAHAHARPEAAGDRREMVVNRLVAQAIDRKRVG